MVHKVSGDVHQHRSRANAGIRPVQGLPLYSEGRRNAIVSGIRSCIVRCGRRRGCTAQKLGRLVTLHLIFFKAKFQRLSMSPV